MTLWPWKGQEQESCSMELNSQCVQFKELPLLLALYSVTWDSNQPSSPASLIKRPTAMALALLLPLASRPRVLWVDTAYQKKNSPTTPKQPRAHQVCQSRSWDITSPMSILTSLAPRPSLAAFFTAVEKRTFPMAKKAAREGLDTRLYWTVLSRDI